jgi:hypothetical protein
MVAVVSGGGSFEFQVIADALLGMSGHPTFKKAFRNQAFDHPVSPSFTFRPGSNRCGLWWGYGDSAFN